MVSKESVLQETDENERVQGHMVVEFLEIIENLGRRPPVSHFKYPLVIVGLRQGSFASHFCVLGLKQISSDARPEWQANDFKTWFLLSLKKKKKKNLGLIQNCLLG